jgi:hypothetical protein
MLGDGRLHLSAIAKLSPHLTPENRDLVLQRATHRSKREIEELVAELSPRPDAPCLVRRLDERLARRPKLASSSSPAQVEHEVVGEGGNLWDAVVELRPGGVVTPVAPRRAEEDLVEPPGPDRLGIELREPSHASPRAVVEPLAPSRYKVQFTASAELRAKLERLQALLRAELPDADLGAVIDRAVTQTLQRLEARRYARTGAPRDAAARLGAPGTATSRRQDPAAVRHMPAAVRHIAAAARHIPAAVRRAVFERDGGRCRYRDEAGRQCTERHRLEYHHLHPFAMGGGHTHDNLRLMCRTHNRYLAEHDYGRGTMTAYRRPIPTG